MNFKFLLILFTQRFDFNVLPRVLFKKLLVSCPCYEKLLGSFENKTVFRNGEEDEAKQHHHDVGYTSELSKKVKPAKDDSLMS